jgi:lipopolysaccharide export system permease protein
MHRHNEITALRAAGVGLFRITRWIWVIAAGLSGLMFYLNGTIIPWSVEQSRLVLDNLKFNHEVRTTGHSEKVGVEQNVTYDNQETGRLWMISRFSRYDHSANNVTVSFLDDQRREVRRLVASEGRWNEFDQRWELVSGHEMFLEPGTGELQRPVHFDRRVFPALTEDPEWMIMLQRRAKDLSFFELRRIIDSPEAANNPRLPDYEVHYHALLAGTFSCMIVAGLAVPFAVSGVRVNPAVGVSKSISLFALFWLVANVGERLGAEGTLNPILAAWVPHAFMAVLAAVFMLRTR